MSVDFCSGASNKLFKKRFEAICSGNFKEDKFRNKLMQFWTIVTKMRDGQLGMDDEDKIININWKEFEKVRL